MNNDEYHLLANTSCSWICPDCHLPNFAPTPLDLSSNTLNLSNSYDILSDSVADTSNNPSRSNPATSSPKRNTKPKLKGVIINCNGLKSSKHSAEFQALLEIHDPDIVLGTESKLNTDIPFNLPVFIFCFSERIETLLAEAAFMQSSQTLHVLRSQILMWMIVKSFGPLSELLIGRRCIFHPSTDHQTLLLRYLII